MKTQFLLFDMGVLFIYIKNINRPLTWNEIYPTKQIDKLIKNVNEMKETF